MNKLTLFIFLITQSLYAEINYPTQVLSEDGFSVHFGQSIDALSRITKTAPTDFDSRLEIGRPHVDKVIKYKNIELHFDKGRLFRIWLKSTNENLWPINMYLEKWKSFERFDEKNNSDSFTKKNLEKYLKQWIETAIRHGAKQVYSEKDLSEEKTFRIERTFNEYTNSIDISFGPSRITNNKGEVHCDMISFYFSAKFDSEMEDGKLVVGTLSNIFISCGRFNTRNRTKSDNHNNPSQPSSRKPERPNEVDPVE